MRFNSGRLPQCPRAASTCRPSHEPPTRKGNLRHPPAGTDRSSSLRRKELSVACAGVKGVIDPKQELPYWLGELLFVALAAPSTYRRLRASCNRELCVLPVSFRFQLMLLKQVVFARDVKQ